MSFLSYSLGLQQTYLSNATCAWRIWATINSSPIEAERCKSEASSSCFVSLIPFKSQERNLCFTYTSYQWSFKMLIWFLWVLSIIFPSYWRCILITYSSLLRFNLMLIAKYILILERTRLLLTFLCNLLWLLPNN